MTPTEILTILQSCLPQNEDFIALHEPRFQGREWEYTKECLDSGWVSSVGKFVDRFEADLAAFTGAAHAVAVVNGTAALHVSLLLAGVRPGDEVLTPALTFVATSNAIAYCHATPHFVDSEAVSLGVDANALADYLADIARPQGEGFVNKHTQAPLRALVVMHTLGHPSDLEALREVADRYRLALVEDAAEGLGSYYHGRHVGNHGLFGTLSFNGNKIITTGGGGAILTQDEALAKHAKHLTTTAKRPHPWRFDHDEVGFNYRLPNLNAALGCAQLEQLPGYLAQKRALAARYQQAFAPLDGVRFLAEPPACQSNYWLNAIQIDPALRDPLLQLAREHKIQARPVWTLQNELPMYAHCPAMPLPQAQALAASVINLPSSPFLALA